MTHWTSLIPSPNFSPVIEDAFRGLLLAVLVAVALTLLRVRSVVAQKAAWVLVLAAAFAMPAFMPLAARIPIPDADAAHFYLHRTQQITATSRAVPVSPLITQTITDEQITEANDAPSGIAQIAPKDDGPFAVGPASAQTATPDPERTAPLITRLQFLFLLYFAVCATMLFRMVRGIALAGHLWHTAAPVDDPQIADIAGSIAVRASARIVSPLNIGSGILFPADYAEWDAEKLAIVLAHEASHVRQRDFYLQIAAQLYAAIFWFSPLGWWMGRKLSDLSEAISDHAGLDNAASPAAYAQVLLEFAALARPTTTGVAMARPGRLSQRIERLLNESAFRQAFTASRVRIAAAVLVVPISLFAATALVRVHAAQLQQTPVTPPPPAEPLQQPAPAPTPTPVVKPDVAPPSTPSKPAEPAPPDVTGPITLQIPTNLSISPEIQALIKVQTDKIQSRVLMADNARALINARVHAEIARAMAANGPMGYWLGSNSDPYVIVRRADANGLTVHVPKTRTWHNMYGSLDEYKTDIDKAKSVAHGDFIWFRRDGKSYIIDDPAILAALEPMQNKIDALGKQQEALGKQQEALGKQQEELGRQMEQVKVPTPDMQKELAKLQAVQSKLAALQGKNASQEQLAEIQGELADVQGRIGTIQGNMGGRMGDLGGKMGELGGQQGKLGAEQGRLGAEQGRLAREMDGKILTTIDESLKNGKARPVQ
jgi:hypothetical protein